MQDKMKHQTNTKKIMALIVDYGNERENLGFWKGCLLISTIALLLFLISIFAVANVSALTETTSICSGSPVDCNTHNSDYNSCIANPRCLPMDEGMSCNTWMTNEGDCLAHNINGCEGNYNWDGCQYYFWDADTCNNKAGCSWTTEYSGTCSGNYELGDEYPDCNGLNYNQCNDIAYSGCSWSGTQNSFCSGNIYVFQGCNPSPSFGNQYFAGCSNQIMPSSTCEELNETDCPTQEGCFWNVTTTEIPDPIVSTGSSHSHSGGSSSSKSSLPYKIIPAPERNWTNENNTFTGVNNFSIGYGNISKIYAISLGINYLTFFNENDFKEWLRINVFNNGEYKSIHVKINDIEKNYTLEEFPLEDVCYENGTRCLIKYSSPIVYSQDPHTNWNYKNLVGDKESLTKMAIIVLASVIGLSGAFIAWRLTQ